MTRELEKIPRKTQGSRSAQPTGWAWLAALLLLIGAANTKAETSVERGRYLVQSIAACGSCHTPQGPNGPIATKTLAGGMKIVEPGYTAYVPNITPDRETGIGRWTSAQIITAIREGKRPDGTIIGPSMSIALYRGISDRDAAAIAAYMLSIPAIKNPVPKSIYKAPLPPNYGPALAKVLGPLPTDTIAYGRYLAGPLGHCIECHSAPGANVPYDMEHNLGTGGALFKGPWGELETPYTVMPNALQRGASASLIAPTPTMVTVLSHE